MPGMSMHEGEMSTAAGGHSQGHARSDSRALIALTSIILAPA